jgi:hypothetical protein
MIDMVTLPFLALTFLLIVAFFIGIVVGATLKGPAGEVEKKETLSTKPRTYTITFTEDQLNIPKQLDENRVLLDISDWKPLLDKQIRFVKPPDVLIKELGDKKPLDRINWKSPIDIENDLINLRDESKKRPRNKNE